MKQRGNLYFTVAIAIGVSLFLAGTHWKAYTKGKAQVQLEWDADKAKVLEATLAAEKAARAKEQELRDAADKQRGIDRAKINSLNRAVADAVEQLRNRPERPAANLPTPAATGLSGTGCTGAGLFRPDAAFLIGIAADADRLRIALNACQRAYQAAVK